MSRIPGGLHRFRAVIVALCLSAAVAPAQAGTSAASRVPSALATHPLKLANGGSFTWSPSSGEVTVLHFWASWCAPCRRELPRIAALEKAIGSQGGRMLAVSIDADVRNAVRFADLNAPGLTVYHDGVDGLARTLNLPALPWTVVLGRDGAVVWSGSGSDDATFAHLTEATQRQVATRPMASETTEGTPR